MSDQDTPWLKSICHAAIIAGGIYAANDLLDTRATNKHLLHAKPENFFHWRGLKMYYEKSGKGSPVILLHDLHPAASAAEWKLLKDLLAENHTVYALDLPGFGRSEKSDQLYTNFFFVEAVKEFIEAMSLGKVILIGSNESSVIGLMASVYAPELFERMVFINPPSVKKEGEVPTLLGRLERDILELPFMGTFIYHLLYCREQIDYSFTEKYFYNPFHETEELVDTYFESAHIGGRKARFTAASILSGFTRINIEHALSTVKTPILLIEGANMESENEAISEWCKLNPNLKVSTIPHTKVLPHLEEPALVSDEIKTFITYVD